MLTPRTCSGIEVDELKYCHMRVRWHMRVRVYSGVVCGKRGEVIPRLMQHLISRGVEGWAGVPVFYYTDLRGWGWDVPALVMEVLSANTCIIFFFASSQLVLLWIRERIHRTFYWRSGTVEVGLPPITDFFNVQDQTFDRWVPIPLPIPLFPNSVQLQSGAVFPIPRIFEYERVKSILSPWLYRPLSIRSIPIGDLLGCLPKVSLALYMLKKGRKS